MYEQAVNYVIACGSASMPKMPAAIRADILRSHGKTIFSAAYPLKGARPLAGGTL